MDKALNDQVQAEFFSAYLYLSMVAYFEDQGLKGCAAWMRAQTQEEMFHGMKFYGFIIDRGGRVVLQALDQPTIKWKSPLAAFEAALKHEQLVTARINALMNKAIEEKDHATASFLQWFVNEQVEEEDSVTAVIQKLKLAGEASGALFYLDNELGQRVFTMPTPAAD